MKMKAKTIKPTLLDQIPIAEPSSPSGNKQTLKHNKKTKRKARSAKSWVTFVNPASVRHFPSLLKTENTYLPISRLKIISKAAKFELQARRKSYTAKKSRDGMGPLMLAKKGDKEDVEKEGKKRKPRNCDLERCNVCVSFDEGFKYLKCCFSQYTPVNADDKINLPEMKCPRPVRIRPLKDCPPDKCKKGAPRSILLEYILSGKLYRACVPTHLLAGKDDKGKSCPDVETDKCKKEDKDDPCGLKKKGITKRCPTDLLERKRIKPKKPKQLSRGVYSLPELTTPPSTSSFDHTRPL